MPVDDIYWNSIDFGTDEDDDEFDYHPPKHYVDPWDLENYAYIRHHLDSGNSSSGMSSSEREANSASSSYIPLPVARREPRNLQNSREIQPKRGYEYDLDEHPYEVSPKDNSISYYTQGQEKWRQEKNSRDRSLSFSYGDYGTSPDIYCKLDEVYPRRDSTLPIYDDVKNNKRKPKNFGLSNYGHLKIDYSYSWNNLDRYICN